MSLFTFWSGRVQQRAEDRRWLATLNMRVDYFRPVIGPRFEMEGRVVHMRGGTGMVETCFYDVAGNDETSEGLDADPAVGPTSERSPLVYGYTTLKVTG